MNEGSPANGTLTGAQILVRLAALGALGVVFADDVFAIKGSADATKLARFEVDGLTTGTTRVYSLPDASITVAGINLAQTWTATQTIPTIIGNPGTSAEQFTVTGRAGLGFPVPYLTPTTGTNTGIAFDLFPKGSPGNNNSIAPAYLDICSTDIIADSNNFEGLRLYKTDAGYGGVATFKGGTGTVRPLALNEYGGNVLIGSTTDDASHKLQVTGTASFTDTVTVSAAKTGSIALAVRNTAAGTGNFARISVQGDGASVFALDNFSSTYTGAVWGITLASYSTFSVGSSTSNGLIIGHTGNKPIIFASSTNEIGRFTSGTLTTGGFSLAYTTDSSSVTTGAFICPGGGAFAKSLFIGGAFNIADAKDITVGSTTGTKIGTATSQKLGFWNVTPVIQPAGAAQAAAAAQGQTSLTDSTGGTPSTTLAAITAGAAYAQADMTAVKNAIASIAAELALVKTDVTNVKTLEDAIRTALVNTGIMKGAA